MKEDAVESNIEISSDTLIPSTIQSASITVSSADLELIKYKISEDLKKEFKTDKSTLMSIFGVFASIITFLSVEVQILQKAISFDQLIFLSLVLFICLLGFILILEWLIKNWIEESVNKIPITLYFFIVLLFILIIYFGHKSTNQNKAHNNLYNLEISI